MATNKTQERSGPQLRQALLNGYWQLKVRSEVIVCQDCGALLPRSSSPENCALCGSGALPA